MEIYINQQTFSVTEVIEWVENTTTLHLGKEAKKAIQDCRNYLNRVVETENRTVYGINTGFGSLCDKVISPDNLEQLQVNLVRSHACGTGEEVPNKIVKTMLLLKAIGLSYGHSGAQVDTIERLMFFYNNNIFPQVYQQGSLGASGDLAPLAHIALAVIGEGKVYYKGELLDTKTVLDQFGLKGIVLQSKEGLALLNGTQFMSAYATNAVVDAQRILERSLRIAAVSLDGFDGRPSPFGVSVNKVRNQIGQIEVAEQMRNLMAGSEIIDQEKAHVQDPYSFRCIPQVLGASLDTINYVKDVVNREINAVTDNPTIFEDEDLIVSAGNFHGQPLALSMDYLAIALAEIGSISERRIYKLISGTRGLPAFLTPKPGLNSGLMIAQYTAASIVSQNKQLCTPASIDTIDSSNGQEDHVSMGANAATKLSKVVENVYQILGVELLAACQALEFRRPLKSSDKSEKLFSSYREIVSMLKEDIILGVEMRKSKDFVKNKM